MQGAFGAPPWAARTVRGSSESVEPRSTKGLLTIFKTNLTFAPPFFGRLNGSRGSFRIISELPSVTRTNSQYSGATCAPPRAARAVRSSLTSVGPHANLSGNNNN